MDQSDHVVDAIEQATHRLSLRERKKIKTRENIRRQAYRLFNEHGYDATTVEQIADAAEVSPSTFFRYFPTKEDVVVTDEYDPIMLARLRLRPPDEPVIASLTAATIEPLRSLLEQDYEIFLTRLKLSEDVPALRARQWEEHARTVDILVGVLAARGDQTVPTRWLRVITSAWLAAIHEAISHWAREDGREDLVGLVEEAVEVLETTSRRHDPSGSTVQRRGVPTAAASTFGSEVGASQTKPRHT